MYCFLNCPIRYHFISSVVRRISERNSINFVQKNILIEQLSMIPSQRGHREECAAEAAAAAVCGWAGGRLP